MSEQLPQVEYDAEADALYVRFAIGDVRTTRSFGLWRNADYSDVGTLLGVEFLDPGSQGLDVTGIPNAEEIAMAVAAAGLRFPVAA